MSLSKQAMQIKAQMTPAILLKREADMVKTEWQDLLLLEEDEGAQETFAWAKQLREERARLHKRLAQYQLRNWVRIRSAGISETQKRILRLRYVNGMTWQAIIDRTGFSKQYLLREHNKALEKIAAVAPQSPDAGKDKAGDKP